MRGEWYFVNYYNSVKSDCARKSRNVVPVRRIRQTQPTVRSLKFGSLNVRSLSPSKLDDLLLMGKDYLLDVMLLCETWHDADSVSIHRLRANNYSFVERTRPRNLDASLSVNHGGVAIGAVAGVRLKEINVGVTPLTFENVAARVTIGHSSCFVIVVYRPGSFAVTTNFFTELSDLLDCLSTLTDPLVIAGDINIRLERASDANTITFGDLIASYGLTQLVSGITHDGGGTLDVVCVRDDQPLPPID